MSCRGEPIVLTAVPARAEAPIPTLPNATFNFEFDLVTDITLPEGTTYSNPQQSSHLNFINLDSSTHEVTVTLPSEKAIRLARIFSQLRPGHLADCHHFTYAIAGWPLDRKEPARYSGAPIEDDEIEPGIPYALAVMTPFGDETTHSGIGTDDGRLLSIMGKGSVLGIMHRKTVQIVYAGSVKSSYLSEMLSP